jgi:hypothetical protein
MALKFPVAYRNTRADTFSARAGSAALLRIYSGTRAANADTAPAGTLLAELTCGTPFAPAASSGGFAANAVTQDPSANATGTATWFRLVSAGGNTVTDGDVTATGGGGDLELVTTAIVAGQPVQVTAFNFTEGGA